MSDSSLLAIQPNPLSSGGLPDAVESGANMFLTDLFAGLMTDMQALSALLGNGTSPGGSGDGGGGGFSGDGSQSGSGRSDSYGELKAPDLSGSSALSSSLPLSQLTALLAARDGQGVSGNQGASAPVNDAVATQPAGGSGKSSSAGSGGLADRTSPDIQINDGQTTVGDNTNAGDYQTPTDDQKSTNNPMTQAQVDTNLDIFTFSEPGKAGTSNATPTAGPTVNVDGAQPGADTVDQRFVNDTSQKATFELTNSKDEPIATLTLQPGQEGDALISASDPNAQSDREVMLQSDGTPYKKFGESDTALGANGVLEANDVSNIDNNDPSAI